MAYQEVLGDGADTPNSGRVKWNANDSELYTLANAGFTFKRAVRAASTANVAIATALENGDTLDGVTLATGNRVLLKNQTTGSENGIYVVVASGAAARAADANTSALLPSGSLVYVTEGTANADKAFALTTNDPITLGTTSLTFAEWPPASAGATDLEGLSDVDLTSPTIRQGLFHDGTGFVNQYEPGQRVAPVAKSASFTALLSEHAYIISTAGGNVTVTLPSSFAGKRLFFKKNTSDANTVTVSGTIDGGSSVVLNVNQEALLLEGDGTGWHTVARPFASEGGGGVPIGGATGEVLTKDSGTSYDYSWQAPSGGSTFDPTTVELVDDFFNNNSTSQEVGDLDWATSVGALATFTPELNHPGAIRRNTSASASIAQTKLRSGSDQSLDADETFDLYFIIRASHADANTAFKLGLVDAFTPSYGIYFEKLTTDTNWFGVCRTDTAGNAQTRSDVGTAQGTSWTKLRIRRTNSTTIAFSVGGGSEVTITTNVPAGGLDPYFSVQTTNTTVKSLDVDLFYMKISGLTR